ncbi:uncharacterized protein LOC120114613 [Hibiscus syriacus]|uniref:uncharacterized protein LOC120114613 n=1 Tax=Hibiscus syriacus TaxID=106335 RepID=UPI001923D0AC|nr:uncharacterized protein LOC120114613 [Hibiscus syriacus]
MERVRLGAPTFDQSLDQHRVYLEASLSPKKPVVVADALSRKSMSDFRELLARISLTPDGSLVPKLWVEPELVKDVKELQESDGCLIVRAERVRCGELPKFELKDSDMLYFRDRLFVPADVELRDRILGDAHCSPLFVHPESDKMYREL